MQNTWENKKGCKLKMLLILITGTFGIFDAKQKCMCKIFVRLGSYCSVQNKCKKWKEITNERDNTELHWIKRIFSFYSVMCKNPED